MAMFSSSEIRQQFIDYFRDKHGHTFVPSSPVVPHDDPTLLFANAGMNQFKDVFLGTGTREYNRVVNTQKCIRAGGKHNDLEDVGRDTIHQTFFEMLGNWSFGDYFKKEAIEWAWDLLTNVWGLPKDRLYATVFEGDEADGVPADTEAEELWKQVTDINPNHVTRWDKKDNFWEMGETGPCGPCSEIHIDLTPDGGGASLVNADDPRVMEIWNLVFIQYNRDASGKLHPLPAKHVDTGLGFERMCAVLQGKQSTYDTDVFAPMFDAIREVTGARPYAASLEDSVDIAYRVIADHIRSLTFAITDGAVPGNEGRGYVLRRILRRAVRHGWQTLGIKEPFLCRLVPAVVDAMGDVFPELCRDPQKVADLIREEEESFERTIDRGIVTSTDAFVKAFVRKVNEHQRDLGGKRFLVDIETANFHHTLPSNQAEKFFVNMTTRFIVHKGEPDRAVDKFSGADISKEHVERYCGSSPEIAAEDAFKLHDTYGFPLDLTQVMAEERGMTVDVEGFNRLMEHARQLARAAGAHTVSGQAMVDLVQKESPPATEFTGYDGTELQTTSFCLLFSISDQGYRRLSSAGAGDEVALITGRTPFYAEAGGQVGDTGTIANQQDAVFRVVDTQKVGEVYFHLGVVEQGQFTEAAGPTVALTFRVDRDRRRNIMANHTTTHMMNRALRAKVNPQADQRGSLVDDQKLRFDFSHQASMTDHEIEQVEQMVNADIASDLPVYYDDAPLQEALNINGLRAVFGEKYPPKVRVVTIGVPVKDLLAQPDNSEWGNYSIEFCGGTHSAKTGDAEGFIIISEEAVARGIRRITALTGQAAHQAAAQGDMLLARAEALVQSKPHGLASSVAELSTTLEQAQLPILLRTKIHTALSELRRIVKEHQKQQGKEAAGSIVEIARRLADSAEGNLVVASLDGADAKTLRTAMDVIRKKRPDAAMLLGAVTGGKIAFLAAVPPPLIAKGLKAGDWVREVAKAAGGGGGGRPDMAQAGGKDPAKLEEALDVGRRFAAGKLG